MSSPTRPDMIGRTLMGKLKVLRVLGAGGMGTVFEVEHLITKHHRALKVLHAQHEHSHETVARFIREAGVAGTLQTPYVVETYDAGTMEDGSAYVLMELLQGRPLSSLLEGEAAVTPGRMVGICCQLLEGLSVAHEAGVIHRDVKPDNVFLLRDEQGRERVKILDFGISKFTHGVTDYAGTLTSEGTMMGTPYYMSPEQASGAKDVDERTDLYSLGVILYEGLAGRRPFDGQTLAALVIKIHKGECVPLETIAPHVSPGLARAVMRAMHHDRSRRYAGAREMLAALIPYADSGYAASLDTLREVAADAPTLQRAAVPIPIAGTLAETMPATSPPVMSVRPPVKMGDSIEVELSSTQGAIEAADAEKKGRELVSPPQRPIAIAPRHLAIGALVIVLGVAGALAWAGQSPPVAPPPPAVASTPAVAPAPAAPVAPAPPVAPTPVIAPDPEPAPAADPSPEPVRPRVRPERATPDEGDPDPRPRGGRGRPGRPEIDRDNPYGG